MKCNPLKVCVISSKCHSSYESTSDYVIVFKMGQGSEQNLVVYKLTRDTVIC